MRDPVTKLLNDSVFIEYKLDIYEKNRLWKDCISRFSTISHVRPAKAEASLRIRAV